MSRPGTIDLSGMFLEAETANPRPDIELMSPTEFTRRAKDIERYGTYWAYGIDRPKELP